jgi:solute carrier family 40 (iron-regulated transporter), member 1
LWSILYQLVFVSVSFAALFMTDAKQYTLSMVLLVGGVCLSRIGLWVFAMTVAQLMQEFIPDGFRGVVGGTQQSLNAFFQLSSFALGLLFPDPRDFPIYVAAGYAAVCSAALAFYLGIYLRRDEFGMAEAEQSR